MADNLNTFLSRIITKNIFFPIIASIITSSLVADTLIAKIYVFTTSQAFSNWRLTSFIIISTIFVVGQYLILEYVKKRIKEFRSSKELDIKRIHTVVTLSQYTIAIILVLMILQMTVTSQYYNIEIIICTTIGYGLSIILLGMLGLRFFSWFRVYRNVVILLYAISSVTISVNICLTLIYVDTIIIQQPPLSRPHSGPVYPTQFLALLSFTSIINLGFIISSITAYLSFWLATSFLLSHYSEKLGRLKYWTFLSIPLIYFVLQFLPSFINLFSTMLLSNPITAGIIYTVIFTLSKPVGGILFGIGFWFVARSLQRNSAVRRYFIMASFGIILLFTSNQAIILVTFTYPVFGLVTVSTVGLSSYLLFLGIYASAISVGQDEKLRHSIRKIALKESKLLDSIGGAQREKELEMTVLKIIENTRETLKAETGIETSFERQDLIDYTKAVIREIKNKSST